MIEVQLETVYIFIKYTVSLLKYIIFNGVFNRAMDVFWFFIFWIFGDIKVILSL